MRVECREVHSGKSVGVKDREGKNCVNVLVDNRIACARSFDHKQKRNIKQRTTIEAVMCSRPRRWEDGVIASESNGSNWTGDCTSFMRFTSESFLVHTISDQLSCT